MWESGHILFAVFRLPFGCKIPPHHTPNIINAKKITFDGRTKTGKPCARSRLRRLRLPCALAPVRLYPFAVAVHVRPLHPHHHPKTTPKEYPQTPTQKQAENPPKTGAKIAPKGGNPPPPKTRANFDMRVTHAHARPSARAETTRGCARQSCA